MRILVQNLWWKIHSCAFTCAGAEWLYLSQNLFALIDILVTLFEKDVVNILLVCEHKL